MSKKEPVIIKKYPNRRLYDTSASTYITIDDLSRMVKKGYDFQVLDAKSGADLTRVTLTQIILEHESQGYELLHLDVIKQIIKFYDHPMNKYFSEYLSNTLRQFNGSFENMNQFIDTVQTVVPFSPDEWANKLTELNRQNSEFFKEIMSLVTKPKKK
ncbi:MAG: polyhydroxyalkanoate synthesis repressor PhaR [Rickettsiales bacterium]